ncbi:related to guanine deaminase [Ramularia collo-cygni]|uniref:Guanine deaminase n=1 Tax=Ramularia collo-cygni TaxID=112498 RepID=A0A2D3UT70_9PEZI|nr:related to guanine deaminase [Ramularia collo-cygni]CZT15970.1 related to guanine deaminase [Ramularia collo-cygni]
MTESPQKTLYIGSFIHSTSLTTLDHCANGVIGVDESGKIAFILRDASNETIPEDWESAKVIRQEGEGFFFPGFVDTHIHASQYPNAGVFGKSTLLDWLNTYTFPLESSFTDLKIASKIYNRVVARTISHGTTTACYYATIHVPATNLLSTICHSQGQRAFVGRVCMDSALSPDFYRDESAAASLQHTKDCITHIQSINPDYALITPIITPRFAPSCSVESMLSLGALHAETGIPVQTHISENLAECELVKAMFPTYKSYADVYHSTGLLTSKTILAHAIHLTPEERSLIKETDAKISHCPGSNTALTSGTAKIRDLLNDGLSIGLGTDVSGGCTPSILNQAREAVYVSRHVAMAPGQIEAKLSVAEALYLATRGGAKVVGLEGSIGGFEVGMDWDAQLVRFGQVGDTEGLGSESDGLVEIFGNESWEDKVAKWLYTGDDRNTHAVWVKGRLVHHREGWRA